MNFISHLSILAVFTSYYSISALNCYKCTEIESDGGGNCTNSANKNSWETINCAGSCVKGRRVKPQGRKWLPKSGERRGGGNSLTTTINNQ